MPWFAAISAKRGYSPHLLDAAIQFFVIIKNPVGLASRQITGFVQSHLGLSKLRWPVSDFSTLRRRRRGLDLQVAYSHSSGGLNLPLDFTGIKFLGEGEWRCKKHGAERPRQWRKLHIGIDAQTLQVRTICVTSNNVGDEVAVPHLLAQASR